MKVVISSGHGKYIRGAAGPEPWGLDEVDEARRVVEQAAMYMRAVGVETITFHDNTSTDQNTNLNTIVDFHNSQGPHDLDVSVHFNAYENTTSTPRGTECLYVTQEELSARMAGAIATASGLINRGPKYRNDLFFLNNTREKAILIEVAFCDSKPDCDLYRQYFDPICEAIAETITGQQSDLPELPDLPDWPDRPDRPPPEDGALLHAKGPCSWFGGPDDTGVDADEGLAFLYDFVDAPHLFLYDQPAGTTGLARRLDPSTFYVACRWDYEITPKEMLRDQSIKARVRAKGKEFVAYPADWGPHQDTGRVADLSPALLQALDLTTDDEVEVIYPATE